MTPTGGRTPTSNSVGGRPMTPTGARTPPRGVQLTNSIIQQDMQAAVAQLNRLPGGARTPPLGTGSRTPPLVLRSGTGTRTPPRPSLLPGHSVTYLQEPLELQSQVIEMRPDPMKGLRPPAPGDHYMPQYVNSSQGHYMDSGKAQQQSSFPYSEAQYQGDIYNAGSDDGIIVDGRWLQHGQVPDQNQDYYYQQQNQVQMQHHVMEPPIIPRRLPWVPGRKAASEMTKTMDKDEFLKQLNDVCDSFQPEEVNSSSAYDAGPHINFQLESAYAAAEEALADLVESAVINGPIRHMALCVMARRVVMLAESIKHNEKTPGGRRLMVALLNGVKSICAADTAEVGVEASERFSGRVVLLLGSTSCTVKYLLETCGARYRQLDPHCIVIALSMGADPAGLAQIGKALATTVNAWTDAVTKFGPPGTAGGAGRPELMVHLFGSNGFAAWARFLRIWDEQAHFPDKKRIRGVVPAMSQVLRGVLFDSAPGESGTKRLGPLPSVQGDAALLGAMTAFGADGSDEPEVNRLLVSQNAMRVLMNRSGALWQHYEGQLEQEQLDTVEVLRREPPVPVLFVYSESDRIANAGLVDQYIAECEGKLAPHYGTKSIPPPRRHKFERSGHCAHRKGDQEEEYWRVTSDFWRIALFC